MTIARPGRSIGDPWTVPLRVTQVPITGTRCVIEPSESEAAALAAAAGVNHFAQLQADLTLTPERGEQVRVEGRVRGRVGQTCVVTLEPIENVVDEPIDVLFAPPDQIASQAPPVDPESDAPIPDPPEPIMNGVIDLGRVATDALFLGLDPYPRKPGAVFDPPPEQVDPEAHPFAALKALKPNK